MKKVNVSASFRVASEQQGRQFSKPKVGNPIEGQHPQDTNNNEAASSNSETTNTSKPSSSKPKAGTKKYRLGRIHVYQEEKKPHIQSVLLLRQTTMFGIIYKPCHG